MVIRLGKMIPFPILKLLPAGNRVAVLINKIRLLTVSPELMWIVSYPFVIGKSIFFLNIKFLIFAIADRMEPYLRASGINVTRNDPEGTVGTSIRASNAGNYDFHLALHSNAAPPQSAGTVRGIDLYYYPGSTDGLRMANILADNLREIYPLPQRVRPLASTSITEIRRVRAPSVLAELGYHDNRADAEWIENNLEAIARSLALSVTEYFGVPFLTPGDEFEAEAAGADYVGAEEYITKIQKENWFDFDVVIASPDMMGVVGRLGKVLGPKGLMPSPKAGTVTPDVAKAVQESKAGKIEYRLDKTNIIHCPIGKVSFGPEKLMDNYNALMGAIVKAKPASAKGQYIKSCVAATTMGPGVKMNTAKLV